MAALAAQRRTLPQPLCPASGAPRRAALGHFDGPADDNPFRRIPLDVVGSREHLALAREAAAKSIVLLKNVPVEPAAASRDPPEVEPCGATRAAVATASHAAGAAEDGAAGARAGAAQLLPLRLHALRRLAVIGPFANRSGVHAAKAASGAGGSRPCAAIVQPTPALMWACLPDVTGGPLTFMPQSTCWGRAPTTAVPPGSWPPPTRQSPSVQRRRGCRRSCSLGRRSWDKVRPAYRHSPWPRSLPAQHLCVCRPPEVPQSHA